MAETVKLNLRMPPDLHAAATEISAVLGVSLNAFIVHALANWTNFQRGRLQQGKPVQYAPPVAEAVRQSPAPATAGQRGAKSPPQQVVPKVGANQPCPCGSGLKYKRCHGKPGGA